MRKDLILVAIIVATLTLMVVPLSQAVIDSLLTINISLSVLLVIVALYLKHPSDFSTFPSVILIGTAFRLALSIGTTRLILSEADAGQIIETFGDFVVRGSVVIGLVIFLIITVVQFLVVTKGAERVAEVSARFALDALPGKQMSIDAEMRNGSITAEEAALRRRRLDKDSQFFGAMDGAMKFIKGDAIAGLIIISINLLGGIAVGMSVHNYGFAEAVGIFSLLTVGDGLVAQIPALLMALCAGIVVTRVANAETSDLGTDIFEELVSDPRVPAIAALVVLAIGLIPGFPSLTFAALALVLFVSGLALRRRIVQNTQEADEDGQHSAGVLEEEEPHSFNPAGTDSEGDIDGADLPSSERLRLVIGEKVGALVDHTLLQKEIAHHFGVLFAARGVRFPKARFFVSAHVGPSDVVIELDEVPVFRETLRLNCFLVPEADLIGSFDGDDGNTDVTSFHWPNLHGVWVPKAQEAKLRALSSKPLSLETALAYVTYRLYEQNLGTLFSHKIFVELMQTATSEEPETTALVREDMTEPALYKMFRYLVEDGVPLRPMSLLMSSLHYWIHSAEQPSAVVLAECLRGSMKRQLCHRIAGSEGILGVSMVDPTIEALARRGIVDARRATGDAGNDGLVFEDDVSDFLIGKFRDIWETQNRGNRQVAIVISADLRRRLRNFLAANDLHFAVLAPHEISSEFVTHPVDLISLKGMADTADARREEAA
ncbi:MAG: FHIPEP family type III secretion protein [Pseudomonadota bacterium]